MFPLFGRPARGVRPFAAARMEKAMRRETNVERSEPTRRDFSLPPPGWSRRSGAQCNEAKRGK